jgi:hypothetical protein
MGHPSTQTTIEEPVVPEARAANHYRKDIKPIWGRSALTSISSKGAFAREAEGHHHRQERNARTFLGLDLNK